MESLATPPPFFDMEIFGIKMQLHLVINWSEASNVFNLTVETIL